MNKNPLDYLKDSKSILIITFSLLFLILFSLFFIEYNSKESRIKRDLKDISNKLNEVNLNLSDAIKDLTIDTDISKNVLSTGIEDLNNLLILVSETEEPSSDISLTKSNLKIAIESTISLYNYTLSILSDPKTINSIDVLDKFNLLKESSIVSYSELQHNKIDVVFSEESLKYFDNFYNYINTLIKINRDSEFKNTQTRDFINSLQKYKNDIGYLNEDLSIAINKVKEDKRDLQVIIDDIYKKEEIYNTIKENISFISVPEGCMEIYNYFNEYLNAYHAYLMSIKEAVIYEKTAANSGELSDEINKNYKNSNSKRNDALTAYSTYENKLKEF